MGFNQFADIEKENKTKLDNIKNEILKNEDQIYYCVILTHKELKKILQNDCPYVQGSFEERLLKAELTSKPRRTIGSGGSIN